MRQTTQEIRDSVLALKITGEVSDPETERMVRQIKAHAARHGKARIILATQHYSSFNSAESLYLDLRFAFQCADLIERMAIVGDRAWKDTWVALFGLFSAIDMAYFDQTEMQTALQWLLETN